MARWLTYRGPLTTHGSSLSPEAGKSKTEMGARLYRRGMDVDLRMMRYVIAVADEGGFQKAATSLHIAQPPLSRQISQLERRLGARLFDRRPVRLTPAGEVFVKRARPILTRAQRMVAETRLAAMGEVGHVRIGYVLSAAYETVPVLLEGLSRHHPQIRTDVNEAWSADLETSLEHGTIDVAVAHTIAERPEFCQVRIRSEPLIAVVPAGHRLANRESIELREFATDTFTFYDPQLAPAHYAVLIRALQATGMEFSRRHDMLPGLRGLRLPDDRSFTLVPRSMSQGLPAGVRPLHLVDTGLPKIETRLVWNRTQVNPAAKLAIAVGTEIAERNWPTERA